MNLGQWLRRLEQLHPNSIDLGLERIRQAWQKLGAPDVALQLITVAGTNGKGSTVHYLESLALAADLSVACYTSPHLRDFNERIRLNGTPVSDQHICAALEEVDQARGDVSLTYFEFTTLAAFLLFSRARPDLAVLEVGLGGRLDAVNLLDADVAVITSIALDHMDWLGPNREAIAYEKSGIMRAGRPVIVAERDPPRAIAARASELGARLLQSGVDYQWRKEDDHLQLTLSNQPYMLPPAPAAGTGQSDNWVAAILALAQLQPELPARAELLARAARRGVPGGRYQLLSTEPEVRIDVGHNPAAATQVAENLRQQVVAGRTFCVLAMLADKAPRDTVAAFGDSIDHWFLCGLDGPRGQSAHSLRDGIGMQLADENLQCCETVAEGLDLALQEAGNDDRILVFGSFHTAGEALDALN